MGTEHSQETIALAIVIWRNYSPKVPWASVDPVTKDRWLDWAANASAGYAKYGRAFVDHLGMVAITPGMPTEAVDCASVAGEFLKGRGS